MKLDKQLKERIDKYFDSISAEELFNIAVTKYNFVEVNIDIVKMAFETTDISKYNHANYESNYQISVNEITYAIAA